MPAKTMKQYRAMQAAAHGKGKRGIPKKVAKEYVKYGPPDKDTVMNEAMDSMTENMRRRKR